MLLSWRLTFASSNARRIPVAYRLSVRFQSFLSGRSQMAFFGLVVFFSPVMASPSQGDADRIDRNIQNELLAEGEMRGPARRDKKLRSLGLTRAKAGLHSSYASGDAVIFNRRYKRLGLEKGDRRTVAVIDRDRHAAILADSKGRKVRWRPREIAGSKGGVEAYRSGRLELRAGDRVRFARNDRDAALVDGQMARVAGIGEDGVRFELEDRGAIALGDPIDSVAHSHRQDRIECTGDAPIRTTP